MDQFLTQALLDLAQAGYAALDGFGDPYWWPATSVTLLLFFAIGWWPLQPDRLHDSGQALVCVIRRLLFMTAGSLVLLFPIALWGVYTLLNGGDTLTGMRKLGGWYRYGAYTYWYLPVLAIMSGLAVHFVISPYVLSNWSTFMKQIRVKPKSDRRSDVRQEHGRFATLDFDPKQYYRLREGLLFVGLQEDGTPHYWTTADFKERHVEIIGSTGLGKGCFLQMLLDQVIGLGWGVFVNDPKWDKQVPHVLHAAHAACLDTDRQFIYHDLNEAGGMVWEPFVGSSGSLREHNIARLVSAWRLNDVADNSAVYKAAEREKIESFARRCNGGLRLHAMLSQIKADAKEEDPRAKAARKVEPRYVSGVREWVRREALTGRHGVGPFKVARAIETNAVTYVRGSLTDHIVQDAMRIMIVEYLQEIERLSVQFPPGYHFVMVIDELPQVLCDYILKALRTMRTFSCTIIAIYQSAREIETLSAADVNGRNAVATLHENCQHKLLYGTIDADTAAWSSEQTGTIEIVTEARESTAQKGRGARWEGEVTYQSEEVPLISANRFLQLPARVGAVLAQGELSRIVRTCYIKVPKEKQFVLPDPKPAGVAGSGRKPVVEDLVDESETSSEEGLDEADGNQETSLSDSDATPLSETRPKRKQRRPNAA